jgi:hypothetical protein
MKPRNLTSKLANSGGNTVQSRQRIQFFRRGGVFWQRFFAILVLMSSILFGPVGLQGAKALDVPVLLYPEYGDIITGDDYPPLGVPEFSWQAVEGATQYHLQVSTSIGFNTTIVDITTSNTKYTPTDYTKFADTDYYWRVQAYRPQPVGDYSMPWLFTKRWAIPSYAPVLTSPSDGAVIEFYDYPIFSWQPVKGAAKYKVQIYTSAGGWGSPIGSVSTNTLNTTYQPASKLTDGTYYWRVVPVDAGTGSDAHEGTPSEERSFTIDYNPTLTLLEPDPNTNTTPTFTPTFRWTAVRGAKLYRLQYTTDPSYSTGITQIETPNTSYTPEVTLPNDINVYWRVQVVSGNSTSEWVQSAPHYFTKRWYIRPTLLTPTNNYQDVLLPLFSWTPVPGAARYSVEISQSPGFAPMFDSNFTANTFYTPSATYKGAPGTYYWRVTPYDGSGNPGKVSDTFSYQSYQDSLAPQLVYPYYYYVPDNYVGFPGVTTNPHEERTMALPVFMWHQVLKPFGDPNVGQVYADSYKVQVATDPQFTNITWWVVTENVIAAPTAANPFTPLPNTNYFWRVRCLVGGVEVSPWSDIWITRFDPAKSLAPTSGAVPVLIRPEDGFEFAEASPLLQWFPMSGATSYDVEISKDPTFTRAGDLVDSATVNYPAYVPTQSLAQRSLGDVDFGVYYWRVRKTGTTSWSQVRRFQISGQSEWLYTRALGATGNRRQIGSDPAGEVINPGPPPVTMDADYDLKDLQAAQDKNYWYFGFHVPTSPVKDVTYGLYLDLDHKASSGATFDPLGVNVITISSFRPEYAIYILQTGGSYDAYYVYIYHWLGSSWDVTWKRLSEVGGQLMKSSDTGSDYLELKFPNTAIGYNDEGGSYAASLFSLPGLPEPLGSLGAPQDSVPSDPNVPGSGTIQLSRFANVTERMNLVVPVDAAGMDPSTIPFITPFSFNWPVGGVPWSGFYCDVRLDPLFTSTKYWICTSTSSGAGYGWEDQAWRYDFEGDNTYYWRARPRYNTTEGLINGAWTQGYSLQRLGFVPQNLHTSVTFATPTLTWDMVEGAEYYELQVDTDAGFGVPVLITRSLRMNSFTYQGTLQNGTYYWRVRVHRNGTNIIDSWSEVQTFTLSLPVPTNLTPANGTIVSKAPTLCWDPIIANDGSGTPVLGAWKYRVQVAVDVNFSSPVFDSINETEQHCWTSTRGYPDGTYYWRVAMLDYNNYLGNYSAPRTFVKQYPVTTLVSPLNGSTAGAMPTFIWTPVNGAAKYKLDVSLTSNFSTYVERITTLNTRYTPVTAYALNKTYYWRVAILDDNGNIGPYTDAIVILDPYPYKIFLPFTKR